MKTFHRWLTEHHNRQQLHLCLSLLETADYFDPASYNQVFEDELDRLGQGVEDANALAALENVKGLDWSGYIVRALSNAGFRGEELEEQLHQVVVKLLFTPGKLFQGWNPSQHGPIEKRFGASVRNKIRNLLDKQSNRRKHLPTVNMSGGGEKSLRAGWHV